MLGYGSVGLLNQCGVFHGRFLLRTYTWQNKSIIVLVNPEFYSPNAVGTFPCYFDGGVARNGEGATAFPMIDAQSFCCAGAATVGGGVL